MEDDLSSIVTVPAGAAVEILRKLGLPASSSWKRNYIPGFGDVAGAFMHWLARQHGPRVPAAYSLMVYELASKLKATCQIVGLHPVEVATPGSGPRFRIDYLGELPARGSWGAELHRALQCSALRGRLRFAGHLRSDQVHDLVDNPEDHRSIVGRPNWFSPVFMMNIDHGTRQRIRLFSIYRKIPYEILH